MSEKTKILCPYCLIKEIAPIQAICPVCYSKEDELEQNSWDDLRERNNTDEIQMFTLAKKVDEAFQVPENEAYACRERHEINRAETLKQKMDVFHRRRILCMVEIFSHIDCSILFDNHIDLKQYWTNIQDYRDMKADYERQAVSLSDILARLTAERAELANGVNNEHPALVAFMKYQNIETLNREILIELVDHIKVYENGNISVKFKFVDELRRIAEYIEINTTQNPAVAG